MSGIKDLIDHRDRYALSRDPLFMQGFHTQSGLFPCFQIFFGRKGIRHFFRENRLFIKGNIGNTALQKRLLLFVHISAVIPADIRHIFLQRNIFLSPVYPNLLRRPHLAGKAAACFRQAVRKLFLIRCGISRLFSAGNTECHHNSQHNNHQVSFHFCSYLCFLRTYTAEAVYKSGRLEGASLLFFVLLQ